MTRSLVALQGVVVDKGEHVTVFSIRYMKWGRKCQVVSHEEAINEGL